MQTVTNTIEKLNALLMILIIDNSPEYLENNGINNTIYEAVNTLTLLNKPSQVYIPHLNEFIEDKQFFIWEDQIRTDYSFSMAMTNWDKQYAQALIDVISTESFEDKRPYRRAEGASKENSALIIEAAELVLSKFEYIEANTVI